MGSSLDTPLLRSASTPSIANNLRMRSSTGTANIPEDFHTRIHTQANSAVLRANFPNFTRWYQAGSR
jgi:hypothetical protein